MKKEMVFKQVRFGDRDVLLFLHTARSPERAGWDQVMTLIRAYADTGDLRRLGIFAVTDGGGPDSVMRAEVMKFYEQRGHSVKTAVVTTSVVGRGIVTAISWFNPYIRAVSPRHADEALAHLGLTNAVFPRILKELEQLQREIPPVACLAMLADVSLAASA